MCVLMSLLAVMRYSQMLIYTIFFYFLPSSSTIHFLNFATLSLLKNLTMLLPADLALVIVQLDTNRNFHGSENKK